MAHFAIRQAVYCLSSSSLQIRLSSFVNESFLFYDQRVFGLFLNFSPDKHAASYLIFDSAALTGKITRQGGRNYRTV